MKNRSEAGKRQHKAYMIQWHKDHPDYARERYLRNRERILAVCAAYRRANPETVKLTAKKTLAKYKLEKPNYYKEQRRKWVKANPERARQVTNKYRQKHPHNILAWNQAARARRKNAITEDCSQKITTLRCNRFCHWCCAPLKLGEATIDHIVPLVRGGKHCNDNLVAACVSCNSSKNDTLVHEWTWTPWEERSNEERKAA